MIEEAEQRADDEGIEDARPAAEMVADQFIEPYALVAVDGRDTYSRFSRANVGGLEAAPGLEPTLSDLVLPQAFPQGVAWPILMSPDNAKTRLISRFPSYSGAGFEPAAFGS